MAEEKKVFTLDDFDGHTSRDSCWLAIDGKVYDVTEFLEEHPGGDDVVVSNAGTDATEAFEEIGHSYAAREMLEKYHIGDFKDDGKAKPRPSASTGTKIQPSQSTGLVKVFQVLLPILLLALAMAIKVFGGTKKEAEL